MRSNRAKNTYDQIVLVRSGVAMAEVDGETVTAGAGDALYFPAGQERLEWNDPARPLLCVMVLFFRYTPLPALPVCVRDSGGRLGLIAQWLLDWAPLPERPAGLLRNTFTSSLLAEYARLSLQDSARDVVFRREVMQAIMLGYPQPDFRLDDLAAATGLSKHHLSRRFQAAAGVGPMTALREWRINQAIMLLQTTRDTVDQIAWRVGLKGQSQLSRLLRRYRDTCPRDLRRQSGVSDPG